MTTTNIDLVKAAYADFQSGNIVSLLGRMEDGITWEQPAPRDVVPFGGSRRGKGEVADFFKTLNETLDFTQFEPREYIASDDTVVAIGEYTANLRSDGTTIGPEGFAMVFRIRNGKVAAFREYTDSLRLVDAIRGQRAGARA
jgi:ketosteroid isomerase-like protein